MLLSECVERKTTRNRGRWDWWKGPSSRKLRRLSRYGEGAMRWRVQREDFKAVGQGGLPLTGIVRTETGPICQMLCAIINTEYPPPPCDCPACGRATSCSCVPIAFCTRDLVLLDSHSFTARRTPSSRSLIRHTAVPRTLFGRRCQGRHGPIVLDTIQPHFC